MNEVYAFIVRWRPALLGHIDEDLKLDAGLTALDYDPENPDYHF